MPLKCVVCGEIMDKIQYPGEDVAGVHPKCSVKMDQSKERD